MVLLLSLLAVVYPLHKGQKAPEDVVAFDTLAAQRLLINLDSLNFLTRKIAFYEIERQYYDSMIFNYKKLIESKDSIAKNYKDIIEKDALLLKKEKFYRNIERIAFVVLLVLALLRR